MVIRYAPLLDHKTKWSHSHASIGPRQIIYSVGNRVDTTAAISVDILGHGRVSRVSVCAYLHCVLCRRFAADRKRREVQMRTQIGQKLEEGGEREKLKELLKIRLKECGWRDQLKDHCRGKPGELPQVVAT